LIPLLLPLLNLSDGGSSLFIERKKSIQYLPAIGFLNPTSRQAPVEWPAIVANPGDVVHDRVLSAVRASADARQHRLSRKCRA
jgi:hypothetical protein